MKINTREIYKTYKVSLDGILNDLRDKGYVTINVTEMPIEKIRDYILFFIDCNSYVNVPLFDTTIFCHNSEWRILLDKLGDGLDYTNFYHNGIKYKFGHSNESYTKYQLDKLLSDIKFSKDKKNSGNMYNIIKGDY